MCRSVKPCRGEARSPRGSWLPAWLVLALALSIVAPHGAAAQDGTPGGVDPRDVDPSGTRLSAPIGQVPPDTGSPEGDTDEGSADADPQPAPPITPDTEVRGLLDSTDPGDWVRGLFALQQAIEANDPPPDWTRELLIEYLTEGAIRQPERTRAIFADPVMRSERPGQEVLIYLLERDGGYEFFPEVQRALARIAATRGPRDRLARILARTESTELYERLFPIVAGHEPNRAVRGAIDRLASTPSPAIESAIVGTLIEFVGLTELSDAAAWQDWWKDHAEDSLLDVLLERKRRAEAERALGMWESANRLLADGAPGPYRNWLLESLGATQTSAVRLRALQELERFVPRLTLGETALPIEQQRELMRPLLLRLQEIISREASLEPDQDLRIRQRALRALATLSMFREDESVAALLTTLIDALPAAGFEGESVATRLGLAAVRAAGTLGAPVGESIDRALAALLPAGENGAWSRVPASPLDTLLAALRQIGARIETLGLLRSVYENRPVSREDALEVLVLGGVPASSSRAALELFGRALEDGDTENLRTLAINGIGRLGRPEGIPALRDAILEEGLGRTGRTAALKSIRSIGGAAALTALGELLLALPETDELRSEILARAFELATADDSLAALESFLLDGEGAPRPWFTAAVARSEVAPILDPGRQPADFSSARPEAFERWARIHSALWSGRALVEPTAETLADVSVAWSAIAQGARSAAGLFPPLPEGEPPTGSRLVLDSIALSAGLRSKLAEHLARQNLEAVWTTLGQLYENEAQLIGESDAIIPLAGQHLAWLIDQVLRHRPFEDDAQFLTELEKFAEKVPLGAAARGRMAEIEARVTDPENPDPVPPTPPSPEGDGPAGGGTRDDASPGGSGGAP